MLVRDFRLCSHKGSHQLEVGAQDHMMMKIFIYEPTDEEEEKQKKKQEMPKSPRLSSSARRRKRRRRTKQSEGPSEPQEPVDAEDQHSFEEPVMGGDGVDDGRESHLMTYQCHKERLFKKEKQLLRTRLQGMIA